MKKNSLRLPAEWEPQSFIQLTFPHKNSDWADKLEEVTACFHAIAKEIVKHEHILVVCMDEKLAKASLQDLNQDQITYAAIPSNDTWARDHGGITVLKNGKPVVLDFTFNGWGLKYSANLDNQITRRLYENNFFPKNYSYKNRMEFILEGGSIESNGNGILLTTARCLLSHNRNPLSKDKIEKKLKNYFGVKEILWLHHGFLAGDDTDSHIDTLARFCSEKVIAYVKCDDPADEHYDELKKMEEELLQFKSFQLVPLPMADAVFDENNHRLPATYANFLILNEMIIMPVYGSPKDQIAAQTLQKIFPNREIVPIDCRILIRQHGSLHCVTMQYPSVKLN